MQAKKVSNNGHAILGRSQAYFGRIFAHTANRVRMLRMFAGPLLNFFPFVVALRALVRDQAFESH
jgi:hypothetical protein